MNNLLQKTKQVFATVGNGINFVSKNLILFLFAAVGILLYFIKQKNKEVSDYKTQIDLAQTQKQADVIQSNINQKLSQNKLLDQEVKQYNGLLAQLEEKRKQLPEGNKDQDPSQVENYWNK